MKNIFMIMAMAFFMAAGCKPKDDKVKQELWIYTSLYKDTIAELTPLLEKDFPGVKFRRQTARENASRYSRNSAALQNYLHLCNS